MISKGDIIQWGDINHKHFGVVMEDVVGDEVMVEYTHSTPPSNVRSGRKVILRQSVHRISVI